jgi:hypothetical protein
MRNRFDLNRFTQKRFTREFAEKIAKIAFAVTLLPAIGVLGACSHAQKKTPELSKLEGKKVALVEVTGEDTARRVAEVALINQLTSRGTFILVSKEDVEAARVAYQQDPSDWKGIAKRAGADYGLVARVLQFQTVQNVGYNHVTVEDSEMEKETGNAETDNLVKVKALTGTVKVELQFADLQVNDVRTGVVEKSRTVTADESKGGIHLPPRLRFLEDLSNEAFHEFFDKYN